jgi:hypothetical protein
LIGLISGRNHPELNSIQVLVAQTLARSGDHTNAVVYLLEVLERYQKNNDQVRVAALLQNIAEINADAGRFNEATTFQKRAYIMMRQMYGEEDAQTVEAKHKCESILRANHVKQQDHIRKVQQDEQAKKDKERLKWLEDDEEEDDKKKTSKKKKKATKK